MRNHRIHSRGFTLVELLISLGISLLLLYGINVVFRAVTEVVRVGNALAVANRKMRGIESAVVLDFEGTYSEYNVELKKEVPQPQFDLRWSGMVPVVSDNNSAIPYSQQPRQPAITIFCKRQIAFMNAADKDADPDGNSATYDENDNNEADPATVTDFSQFAQMARLGVRAHRVDTIGFFSGGSFAPHAIRSAGSVSGDAPQAWVWYGHLLQHNSKGDLTIAKFDELKPFDIDSNAPLNPGRFFQPGFDDVGNVRNFYATDWVLGRMAITLLPRKNSTTDFPGVPTVGNTNGQQVFRVFGETVASPTAIAADAQEVRVVSGPPGPGVSTYADPGPPGIEIDSKPLDLPISAADSVPFTSGLSDVAGIWPGNDSVGGAAILPTGSVGTLSTDPYNPDLFRGLVRRYFKLQTDPSALIKDNWWARSMVQGSTPANPIPTDGPDKLWYPLRFDTVKAFGRPVSAEGPLKAQDKAALQSTFLAQGCTQFIVEFAGDFLTQGADGTVSGSTIAPDGVVDFSVDTNGNRHTQWYGLPRDVDGNGLVDGNGTITASDVMPICRKINPAAMAELPNSIEKKFLPDLGDYVVAFGPADMYPATQLPSLSIRPSLIRLVVTLNDSAGNLPTGLTREFVFKVR